MGYRVEEGSLLFHNQIQQLLILEESQAQHFSPKQTLEPRKSDLGEQKMLCLCGQKTLWTYLYSLPKISIAGGNANKPEVTPGQNSMRVCKKMIMIHETHDYEYTSQHDFKAEYRRLLCWLFDLHASLYMCASKATPLGKVDDLSCIPSTQHKVDKQRTCNPDRGC